MGSTGEQEIVHALVFFVVAFAVAFGLAIWAAAVLASRNNTTKRVRARGASNVTISRGRTGSTLQGSGFMHVSGQVRSHEPFGTATYSGIRTVCVAINGEFSWRPADDLKSGQVRISSQQPADVELHDGVLLVGCAGDVTIEHGPHVSWLGAVGETTS